MSKFFTIILAIFEFFFYTIIMVLLSEIVTDNTTLKLIANIISLIIIALILYFLIRSILKKLKMKPQKYLYLIPIWNLILGLIFPVLLIIIIPSTYLTNMSILVIVSTMFYGIFINIIICLLNKFFTN